VEPKLNAARADKSWVGSDFVSSELKNHNNYYKFHSSAINRQPASPMLKYHKHSCTLNANATFRVGEIGLASPIPSLPAAVQLVMSIQPHRSGFIVIGHHHGISALLP
jgi:hypothetical protein